MALRKFTESKEKTKQAIYLKFDLPQNISESQVMSKSTASKAVGQLHAPTTENSQLATSPIEGQSTAGPRTLPTEGWSTMTPPYPKSQNPPYTTSKPSTPGHFAGAYDVPFDYYGGRKRGIFSIKVR